MLIAKKLPRLSFVLAALAAAPAYATNGLNQENYGSKAGGMGGASAAYDSRNSALMNNPATLTLRPEGWDIGVGFSVLNPDVNAQLGGAGGPSFHSSGETYVMPSLSLIRKDGAFAYGFGISAQGGMGAEYDGAFTAALTGGALNLPQRSELGFLRVMLPLAYEVNDALSIAAQIDYGRVSLDMQMLDPASMSYIDVSDDSRFNGKMSGTGWGFNLGIHYKVNKDFALGAAYHSKTSISDLTGSGTINMSVPADFRVVDMQWPETYTIGMAWDINEQWMIAADIKQIMWSTTMQNFNFGVEGNIQSMPMNWSDQTVYMLGTQYKITPTIALRAGFNYGKNPVPADTLNYLFPAITETHYTLGLGWDLGGGHTLSGSMMYAPSVEQTGTGIMNSGLTMSHSQFGWGMNYNYSFK
ncbi:MAG: OmpP1/FadL family transporter [Halothiobacillaceae bacterium]